MNKDSSAKIFSIDDLRKAFEGGRDSKKPILKCESYGDMDFYASSEITKSFKTWKHENYKNNKQTNKYD